MPITDCQSFNNEFQKAFQQIYMKQEVDDSSEAIQEFLDSDNDNKPSKYLNSKVLTAEESQRIEVTLSKLQYAHFYQNQGLQCSQKL